MEKTTYFGYNVSNVICNYCAIKCDENCWLTIFQETLQLFPVLLLLNDTLFAFNALNNNCDTMCSLSNSSATCTRILKSCLNVNEV